MSSPSDSTTIAWRRTSPDAVARTFFSSFSEMYIALWSEVEPFGTVWRIAVSRAGRSEVNCCRIETRLSKSMICAMSSGFNRRTKPTAASCASRSLSSMLALVSMSSDSAIGSCALLK